MVIFAVAVLATAWIEINLSAPWWPRWSVAVLATAWIEMAFAPWLIRIQISSPSLRRRGLKYLCPLLSMFLFLVAVLATAWIEIKIDYLGIDYTLVAVLATAWIEMRAAAAIWQMTARRYLAVAWIEISFSEDLHVGGLSLPRDSVD